MAGYVMVPVVRAVAWIKIMFFLDLLHGRLETLELLRERNVLDSITHLVIASMFP